jgi:hypothetical protein
MIEVEAARVVLATIYTGVLSEVLVKERALRRAQATFPLQDFLEVVEPVLLVVVPHLRSRAGTAARLTHSVGFPPKTVLS